MIKLQNKQTNKHFHKVFKKKKKKQHNPYLTFKQKSSLQTFYFKEQAKRVKLNNKSIA